MGARLGIDSAYTAPSGAPVSLGIVPVAVGIATPEAALLRANPGGLNAIPGMIRVYTNAPGPMSAANGALGWGAQSGLKTSPISSDQLGELIATGVGALYYFVGSPDAASPEGYYFYSPTLIWAQGGAFSVSAQGAQIGPPFGQAPGTAATDLSDFQWAQAQLATWTAGRANYAFNPAAPFLAQSGTQSTLSTVASPATTPSSSQIGLYAALALGVIALIYYEF